ncbi:MAG TPA: ABC transporter ATP-binding protein [Acidimicrobiales bacterium]|nr:ABC transporter ATP-binding protein [Acidimicrobiales bacterium]
MAESLFGSATFAPGVGDIGVGPARMRPVEVLRACRSALGLVRTAAGRELGLISALELVSTGAIGAQVLLARSFLAHLVTGRGVASHLGSSVPYLLAAAAVTGLAAFCNSVAQERQFLVAELTSRLVETKILTTAGSVELAAFDGADFFDGLQRAQVNASLRPYQLAAGLVSITTGVLGVLGLGAALLIIQPLVVPVVLLGCFPLLAVATRNARVRYRSSYALTPKDRARRYLAGVLIDKDAAAEMRVLGAAGWLRQHHAALFEERIQQVRAVVRERERRTLAAVSGTSLMMVLAMVVLLELTVTRHMSLASSGAAALAVLQLVGRIRSLSQGLSLVYEGSLFLHDLDEFLSQSPTATAPTPPAGPTARLCRVRLEKVEFTYPGASRPALAGVSFELSRGELVALVGANGSGKTTLAKLICGLYPPSAGTLAWEGPNGQRINRADLAGQVSLLAQNFERFEMSAQTNIAIGDPHRFANLAQVKKAAQSADVDSLLSGLDSGYETPLSRSFGGGTELSSGQWQRVALARALFGESSLLVLDEPTSALDPDSESLLLGRIRDLCADRMVLLISHRLPAARLADRIYLVSDGRLSESGDHQSLMRARGQYARLFELQSAGFQLEDQ